MLSGRRLDLLDPSPLDVEIVDIAQGLARVARWNGQTQGAHAFSVAQHSILVEATAAALKPGLAKQMRLAALLHDAAEYVIGDLISPFKTAMGANYKAFEERIARAIHIRFKLPPAIPAQIVVLIKKADKIVAYYEATQLAGFAHADALRYFGDPKATGAALPQELERLEAWDAPTAQNNFLARFEALHAIQTEKAATMNHSLRTPSAELLSRFEAIVGKGGAITDPQEQEPYLREWRDRYVGRSPLILRPATVEQVSAILALAHEERIAIVPQGGNTGAVGGQIPFESGDEIVLSLERMKSIRAVDAPGNSITVEAGVTLQSVQDAAAAVDRLFPLSLASEGTCQIGGNLATNAGGIHVLRYGNARDLVFGLEAVFPGGRVWNGLKTLRKDNTGYDLKNLLIGSEGTLGVITAATLKLFPRPAEVTTVFAGLPSLDAAAQLFNSAFEKAGPLLTAFELFPRMMLEFLFTHQTQFRDPLAEPHPWYVLFEVSSPLPGGLAENVTMTLLEKCLEKGIVTDAAVAASEAQAHEFWRMRETMPEIQKYEGGSIKHDVSVPVSACAALHRGGNRRRKGACAGRASGAIRPFWRWQYSFQHHAAEGHGQGGVSRAMGARLRCGPRHRFEIWRLDQRGARRWAHEGRGAGNG